MTEMRARLRNRRLAGEHALKKAAYPRIDDLGRRTHRSHWGQLCRSAGVRHNHWIGPRWSITRLDSDRYSTKPWCDWSPRVTNRGSCRSRNGPISTEIGSTPNANVKVIKTRVAALFGS